MERYNVPKADPSESVLGQGSAAGAAGVVSYIAWEWAFWIGSFGVAACLFNLYEGHWPDLRFARPPRRRAGRGGAAAGRPRPDLSRRGRFRVVAAHSTNLTNPTPQAASLDFGLPPNHLDLLQVKGELLGLDLPAFPLGFAANNGDDLSNIAASAFVIVGRPSGSFASSFRGRPTRGRREIGSRPFRVRAAVAAAFRADIPRRPVARAGQPRATGAAAAPRARARDRALLPADRRGPVPKGRGEGVSIE